jgi:hypothetical protein
MCPLALSLAWTMVVHLANECCASSETARRPRRWLVNGVVFSRELRARPSRPPRQRITTSATAMTIGAG